MRNRLSDGTIVESNLAVNTPHALTQRSKEFLNNNGSLKIGNVIQILYPEDIHNLSKKLIEYHVAVLEKNLYGSSNLNIYNNCVVSNLFGSANNSTNHTYQARDDVNTKGASVLILCVGGNSQGGSAIILGGLDKTDTNYIPSASDGQFYDFNFNGINVNINNDGEYSLIFNSKVDIKGKKANEQAAGTSVKIDKDGKLTLSDNEGQFLLFNRVDKISTWGNGTESISVDKQNHTISLISTDKISVNSKNSIKIDSKGTIDSSSDKDYNISSGSNLTVKSKASMNMKADATMNLDAGANFKAKGGAVAILEGGSVVQVKAPITLLGQGSFPVGIAGISISLGFDSMGSPVISQLLTGSFTVFAGT
jgi:hypothetical protein